MDESDKKSPSFVKSLPGIKYALKELTERQYSATDLVDFLFQETQRNRNLNIYISETFDHAHKQAEISDTRIKQGKARPLEGIPLAVKDNFCTKGIRTTAGSKMLHNFVPTYESTVTQKLWDAGAILLGKTNLDEFAMGSSTENSYFGPTINPIGKKLGLENLTPGGSSGGSAAAVACGLALGAIGSDTGGSIRQPASYCGVVGMKPTYGLCSRWGIAAYASSLDQAGAFGRTVKDVAILMDVIMGKDDKDSTSVDRGNLNLELALNKPLEKTRIAIPKEIREVNSTYETELVWGKAEEIARKFNCDLIEVSMPNLKYALPAYYIIALSEASSNLSRYDGVRYGFREESFKDLNEMFALTRGEGFGTEAIRRILMGTFSLSSGYYSAYYQKAQKVRNLVVREFANAFACADLMLMPTAPTGAFELGAINSNPIQRYLEDVFTVPINMAGLPACTLPVAIDKRGMPLGIQVIGPRFKDETVIGFAQMIENANRFNEVTETDGQETKK